MAEFGRSQNVNPYTARGFPLAKAGGCASIPHTPAAPSSPQIAQS
jgi:hypothetical protein